MITLYRQDRKPLNAMTIEELNTRYHLNGSDKDDLIKEITDNTYTIFSFTKKDLYINSICVKVGDYKIYTDFAFNHLYQYLIFEKIDHHYFYANDCSPFNIDHSIEYGNRVIFNHLTRITQFLEIQSWYVSFNLLPLLHDIIKYTGLLFIDYHQLYNIKINP